MALRKTIRVKNGLYDAEDKPQLKLIADILTDGSTVYTVQIGTYEFPAYDYQNAVRVFDIINEAAGERAVDAQINMFPTVRMLNS